MYRYFPRRKSIASCNLRFHVFAAKSKSLFWGWLVEQAERRTPVSSSCKQARVGLGLGLGIGLSFPAAKVSIFSHGFLTSHPAGDVRLF